MLEYIFSLFVEKDLKQQLSYYYQKQNVKKHLTKEQKHDCKYVTSRLKECAIGGGNVAIILIRNLNDVDFVINYFRKQNLIVEKTKVGFESVLQISGWVD